ncbi:MAG: GldG family protein [Acidobacteriota bacterium]|nr:GldG family protein [Acidobacteriota bacterium]MDH3524772.1 GldG family protein [Acidobacteriota bacterium]
MSEGTKRAGKAATEISLLSAGVVLAAALLLLVNYFGWKYHQRFDWTESAIYSLSEKTENVLAALDRDVDVVVFMEPGEQLYQPVKELLARYEAASPRLTVREVDPSRNLAEAQSLVDRYAIDSVNVIVFESGGDRRLVEAQDLAEYDYSGLQFGQGPRMTGFTGEQSFTSALVELGGGARPKVLFTTGHGELQLGDFSPAGLSAVEDLLARDNFEVESWASLGQTAVPAGTQLVVIAGPTGNFLPPELAALTEFLKGGGRLLVLVDPTLAAGGGLVETGLGPFLDNFGVTLGDDIVVDPANPLPFFGADTIYVNNYGSHVITRSLGQTELPTILSLARSVSAADGVEGFDVAELLMTTDEGWGETDLAELGRVEKEEGDLEGPVSLGVAVSAVAESAGAPAEPAAGADEEAAPPPAGERLVVIGDATFATNGQLQNVGNLTLLANALNWLAERESLVGIAAKTPESVSLMLSAGQMRRIFWLSVAGLPALVIALGVFVYRRRRS